MSDAKCPRCGSALEGAEPDRLERCSACGSLIAAGEDPRRPLVARPRLDPQRARILVARALADTGRTWLPGDAQLVLYPFAPTGAPRRPFAPLAQMPPALAHGWRPAGADLMTWSGATSAGVLQAGAVRVPASLPAPAQLPVVHYPFYRVPLQQGGRDSAAWVDASSEQVVLPPDLSSVPQPGGRGFAYTVAGALSIGALAGMLLPFPVSLLPLFGVVATVWWRTRR